MLSLVNAEDKIAMKDGKVTDNSRLGGKAEERVEQPEQFMLLPLLHISATRYKRSTCSIRGTSEEDRALLNNIQDPNVKLVRAEWIYGRDSFVYSFYFYVVPELHINFGMLALAIQAYDGVPIPQMSFLYREKECALTDVMPVETDVMPTKPLTFPIRNNNNRPEVLMHCKLHGYADRSYSPLVEVKKLTASEFCDLLSSNKTPLQPDQISAVQEFIKPNSVLSGRSHSFFKSKKSATALFSSGASLISGILVLTLTHVPIMTLAIGVTLLVLAAVLGITTLASHFCGSGSNANEASQSPSVLAFS